MLGCVAACKKAHKDRWHNTILAKEYGDARNLSAGGFQMETS